jgi:signal transduction histidine kinase
MGQQISAGLDFVRRIASDLRPSVLDKLGIAAALDWQAREMESRTGLTLTVDTEDFCDVGDEQTAITLFRIAQEALTNVVRHAGAQHVVIRLAQTPDGTLLEVKDDGRGFAAGLVEHGGSLGITGMRERAMLIGAVLSIESAPGAGTRLRVLVPEQGGSQHEDIAGG